MSFKMYHMDLENGKVYVEENGRLLNDYEVMAKSRDTLSNKIIGKYTEEDERKEDERKEDIR